MFQDIYTSYLETLHCEGNRKLSSHWKPSSEDKWEDLARLSKPKYGRWASVWVSLEIRSLKKKNKKNQISRKLRSIIKQEKSHIEPPTEDMHQVHGYNQTGVALSWNYYKYKRGGSALCLRLKFTLVWNTLSYEHPPQEKYGWC